MKSLTEFLNWSGVSFDTADRGHHEINWRANQENFTAAMEFVRGLPLVDHGLLFAAIADFDAQELAKTKAADIAARRYQAEVGGIVINGMNIPSDRDTQMKMMAARIRAKEDPGYSVQWKTPGGFVLLDSSSVIAIADALADHVQACFNREAALLADSTLDINTGWPGQAA